MPYIPSPYELSIINQHTKDIYIKVELLNSKFETINKFDGDLISGNYSNDSESNSRRTFNCQMLVKDDSMFVGHDRKIWLDRYIRIYYGIKPVDINRNIEKTKRKINIINAKISSEDDPDKLLQLNGELQETERLLVSYQEMKDCKWWLIGTFAFTQAGYSYSAEDNTLSLSCNDLMCLYDGTIDGQIKMDEYLIYDDQITFNSNRSATLSYYIGLNKYVSYDIKINNQEYKKISATYEEELDKVSKTPIKQTWTLRFGDYILSSTYDIAKLYSTEESKTVLTKSDDTSETIELQISINTETNYDDVNKYQATTGYTFTIYAGQPIKPTIIALCKSAGIQNYIIEDYDENHNTIPHDLTYSDALTYYDVWKDIRDLYTDWEFCFNEEGTFVWKRTPTGESGQENERIVLNNRVIDNLIISESRDHSFQGIYNITEVWGKSLEITQDDRYANESAYDATSNSYTVSLEMIIKDGIEVSDRDKISSYLVNLDKIAFFASDTNIQDAPTFIINAQAYDANNNHIADYTLPSMQIISDDGDVIKAGRIQAGNIYVLTYRNAYINTTVTPSQEWKDCLYFNGQTQCFGRYVETDPKIAFSVANTRPLVKRVNYDHLYSDDLCVNQAEYLTYQSCQMKDTINLTMVIIPWLNTNEKIQYLSQNEPNRESLLASQDNKDNDIPKYIIKNISWSLTDGTMTLQLYRWYPSLGSTRYPINN